jgi:carboxyl-terminal processing protease
MGRIAHIRILRFSGNTTTDLVKAVNRARAEIGPNMAGIILDLRNNPGGYLDQANSVSDVFLESGRIISTRGRHPRSRRIYWARPGDTSRRAPIVLLVNGNSASSAEIVASALQDNGRAVIVGSNSFGKGTVQSVAPLPNGGEIIITWSRFHAPSGYALESLGVLPNVCTSRRTPTAQAAINRLNSGKTLTRYVFRTWRQRIRPVKWAAKLRRSCPARRAAPEKGKDIDVEVARLILLRPSLYNAARRLGQAQSARLQ